MSDQVLRIFFDGNLKQTLAALRPLRLVAHDFFKKFRGETDWLLPHSDFSWMFLGDLAFKGVYAVNSKFLLPNGSFDYRYKLAVNQSKGDENVNESQLTITNMGCCCDEIEASAKKHEILLQQAFAQQLGIKLTKPVMRSIPDLELEYTGGGAGKLRLLQAMQSDRRLDKEDPEAGIRNKGLECLVTDAELFDPDCLLEFSRVLNKEGIPVTVHYANGCNFDSDTESMGDKLHYSCNNQCGPMMEVCELMLRCRFHVTAQSEQSHGFDYLAAALGVPTLVLYDTDVGQQHKFESPVVQRSYMRPGDRKPEELYAACHQVRNYYDCFG